MRPMTNITFVKLIRLLRKKSSSLGVLIRLLVLRKINQSYFDLADTFHEVISKVKGIKSVIKREKEIIVNTIEQVKDIVPIDKALKIFKISISTFENYKSILIHKCESSYFNWCTKRLQISYCQKKY